MRPKLRELEIGSHEHEGEEWFHLRDREGFSAPTAVPMIFGPLLSMFDGTRDTDEILRDYARQHGEELPRDFVENFIAQMDKALLLDSEHFAQFRRDQMATWNDSEARPPAFAGMSYPDDADELRDLLNVLLGEARDLELFSPDAKIASAASTCTPENSAGVVVPHIDFGRGGAGGSAGVSAIIESTSRAFVRCFGDFGHRAFGRALSVLRDFQRLRHAARRLPDR